MSFWIHKSFHVSITEALDQFKKHQYLEKLQTHITSQAMPSDIDHLVAFLYNFIIHIWWYVFLFYFLP